MTKFDQNWFIHFGTTLDYVVDRKKEFKRNRIQAKFACIKKEFKRNRTQAKFACVKKDLLQLCYATPTVIKLLTPSDTGTDRGVGAV